MNNQFFKNSFALWMCFSLLVLLGFSACESTIEEINTDQGYDYFQFTPGFWAVYQVDSLIYSNFATEGIDTASVQLREEYGELFTDNAGRTAITINRYVRSNPNTPWKDITPRVWYAVLDTNNNRAERIEGDLRFMNLVFPVSEGRSWSGNSFLNTEFGDLDVYLDWDYRYNGVGKGRDIDGESFANTVQVVQNDYADLVDKIYSEEVYAEGVGLVYKEQWILNAGSNFPCQAEEWLICAEIGHYLTMKIIDYQR